MPVWVPVVIGVGAGLAWWFEDPIKEAARSHGAGWIEDTTDEVVKGMKKFTTATITELLALIGAMVGTVINSFETSVDPLMIKPIKLVPNTGMMLVPSILREPFTRHYSMFALTANTGDSDYLTFIDAPLTTHPNRLFFGPRWRFYAGSGVKNNPSPIAFVDSRVYGTPMGGNPFDVYGSTGGWIDPWGTGRSSYSDRPNPTYSGYEPVLMEPWPGGWKHCKPTTIVLAPSVYEDGSMPINNGYGIPVPYERPQADHWGAIWIGDGTVPA